MIAPDVGSTFRQFQILERVGAGGMGEVYRARDTKLGRDVALKFLTNMERLAPADSARVRREAEALARLNHPNILTIYDSDELDGIPFLILEWIGGTDLSEMLRSGAVGLNAFFQVAVPLVEALGAVHRAGMVHRDLKPANILVAEDGRIKLVDFGLAKALPADQHLTQTGMVVGTVAYMSPEQIAGGEVGPPSDVFAFGILAYELLSGQRPFGGDSVAALAYGIVHKEHRSLADIRRDIPGEVAAFVDRCLDKNPAARWPDGDALARELRRLRDGSLSGASSERADARPDAAPSIPAPIAAEQDIRFCTTQDGFRIAYSVIGAGPPLVRVLGWFTHLEMEWSWPDLRLLWERLAEKATVIRYDGRGIGLSDRYSGEFTEETRLLDLEAVVDAVGRDQVSLMGISEGGWTAGAYAVAHRDRVSRLVLYGAYARGARARAGYDPEEDNALVTLMRKGWGRQTPAFRQLFTSQFFPNDADPELIACFNELQRVSADSETAARYVESCHRREDGRPLFAQIDTPTLVVHRREDRTVGFEEGRYLASVIPGAKFVPLPGGGHYFPTDPGETRELVDVIHRFVRS